MMLTVLFAVMAALAISYAASYLLARRTEIESNGALAELARRAADTGVSVGMQKVFSSQWPGVNGLLAGGCGDNQSFEVRFLPGDAVLAPGDADYSRLPLRITMKSIGKAWRQGRPDYPAVCEKSVVLELVPRALAPQPQDWPAITSHTVYQTQTVDCKLNVPYRFQGNVRFQRGLSIADAYPSETTAWQLYMDHLRKMMLSGYPDFRPFSATVTLPFAVQPSETVTTLAVLLGVETRWDAGTNVSSDLTLQTGLTEYRLFPGGPSYVIPGLSGVLENTTLGTESASNPLGLYYCGGNIELRDNVTVQGSLYADGDIIVTGSDILLQPAEMPAPGAGDARLRIPTLSGKKLHVDTFGTSRTIHGLVGLFGHFHVRESAAATELTIQGKVFAPEFRIDSRTPWDGQDWRELRQDFEAQYPTASGENRYFPLWLRNARGLDPAPRIRVESESEEPTYHWLKAGEAIYAPGPNDKTALDPSPGLRWSVIRWDSAAL
ncbi:MAG: hypothetical protein GYA33_13940 [Thermogutta sp.]|nr:hypothetical protein [Thermogutta sp.]